MTPNEPVKVGDTLYFDNGTRNAPLWLDRRDAILADRGLRGLILDALETEQGIASLHLRSVRNSLPESERDDYYNEVERLLGDTFEQLRNMRKRVKSYGEQLESLSERGWLGIGTRRQGGANVPTLRQKERQNRWNTDSLAHHGKS